jgi:outer membrane protein OmpA-like peptidoglycan-associated protein
MKRFCFIIIVFFAFYIPTYAQFGDILNKVKDKAQEKVEKKIDDTMDKSDNNNNDNKNSDNKNETVNNGNNVPSTKTYQNYDFVPGDKIIFEDNFADDESGEFPSHWNLAAGQAQVSNFQGENIFALTEGNYASVFPLMKSDTYLASDTFTVEFDYYTQPGGDNNVGVRFWDPQNSDQNDNSIDANNAAFIGYECTANDLSGTYPEDHESFENNKWHHVAIARKGNQLKIYEDQYRILNVPVFKGNTYAVNFVGIGDKDKPIMLRNVRIAQGGNFNDTKRIVSESRIITHGILFDVDKAVIKPESMGAINQIFRVLKQNPDIKYEIDGHTDNTGNSKHNLELSQQRADAVKTQLVSMGIDSSRLTTKGYGDTEPISDNSTPEGKANNRRVEFIKM